MTGRSRAAERPALTPRAARARNVWLRHAAFRLGLPVPADADLTAIAPDVSLPQALDQWATAHERTTRRRAPARAAPRRGRMLRTLSTAAMTLLALALSYGRAG